MPSHSKLLRLASDKLCEPGSAPLSNMPINVIVEWGLITVTT